MDCTLSIILPLPPFHWRVHEQRPCEYSTDVVQSAFSLAQMGTYIGTDGHQEKANKTAETPHHSQGLPIGAPVCVSKIGWVRCGTVGVWHGGSGACTAASQQDGHGFDSRMGRCWRWGAGPPQTFSAQVGYLPGLSVWSLRVHKGFPPIRTPTDKHAKMNSLLSCPSVTDG